MTNKFKTLLKTSAALATLMAGSQSWGAATLIDEGAADVIGSTKSVATRFGSVTPGGTVGAMGLTTLTMTLPNTHFYASSTTGGILTIGSTVFSKDSYLHLLGPAANVILTAVTAPSAGKGYIDVKRPAVTLTANPDNKFVIIADYPLGSGSTITGAAAALAAELVLASNATLAIITSLTGKLSGSGNLIPGAVASVTGDVSKFEGTYVQGATPVLLEKGLPKGTLEFGTATAVTVNGGSIKLVRPAAVGGIIVATSDITIEELDLRQNAIDLRPASGKTITVKRITGGSDQGITVNGVGTVKVLKGSTSGALTLTAGSFIEN